MSIQRRLNFIRGYLSPSRDFPIGIKELCAGLLCSTCQQLARPKIEFLREEGDFLVLKTFQLPKVLYLPKTMPLYNLSMVIVENLYADDWHYYEVPETRVMPDDIVLDCGAAEGLFSLQAMERARQIIAFEPLPLWVACLNRTFAGTRNVRIVPKALGSNEKTGFLQQGVLNSSVGRNSTGIPVDIVSVDHWFSTAGLERIDYIKGDIEGFELEVLKGAKQIIRLYKPRIALTTYHDGNNWREILDFCRSLVPTYAWRVKGIRYSDCKARPIMIHLWPV